MQSGKDFVLKGSKLVFEANVVRLVNDRAYVLGLIQEYFSDYVLVR